jgi:hypothetical protein
MVSVKQIIEIRQKIGGHDTCIVSPFFLAAHFHFAAIHLFLDGNGRTARALEAFMLQKVG